MLFREYVLWCVCHFLVVFSLFSFYKYKNCNFLLVSILARSLHSLKFTSPVYSDLPLVIIPLNQT